MISSVSFMGRIMALFDRHEKRQALLLFVMIVVMAFLELLGVSLILPFVDILTKPDLQTESFYYRYLSQFFTIDNRRDMILIVGVIVIIVTIIANIFKAFTTSFLYHFTYMRDSSISTRLLASYLDRPYAFFLAHNSSDLTKNILNEVGVLVGGIVITGMLTLSRLVVTSALFLFLFFMNPVVTCLVTAGFGAFYVLIYLVYHRKIERLGELRHKIAERRFNTVKEAFANIKENKIYGLKGLFLDAYRIHATESALYSARHEIIGQIPRFFVEAVGISAVIGVMLYVTLIRGIDIVDLLPMMTLFIVSGYKMLPNLQQIFAGLARIRFTLPVLKTIADELSYRVPVRDDSQGERGAVVSDVGDGYVTFRGVSFSYAGDRGTGINGLDFTVNKGEVIGIVGQTGAGKTTLIDVLLGLLDISQGDIIVNGHHIHDTPRDEWFSLFSYVSQHISLFDASIAYNMTLGVETTPEIEKKIHHILKLVDLETVVQSMPQGILTPIGENGANLSGGQRQRLSIARALYMNRHILILDEATSALDAIVERKILGNLKADGDKTIFMISHRLSTLTGCDRIMVLENGRLVDFDRYDVLAIKNAMFKAMLEQNGQNKGITYVL